MGGLRRRGRQGGLRDGEHVVTPGEASGELCRRPRLEVGAARPGGVERVESLRGLQENRRGSATTVNRESDLRAEKTSVGPAELIERPCLRRCERRQRAIEVACEVLGACSRERPLRAREWFRGHHGRELEED